MTPGEPGNGSTVPVPSTRRTSPDIGHEQGRRPLAGHRHGHERCPIATSCLARRLDREGEARHPVARAWVAGGASLQERLNGFADRPRPASRLAARF